MIDIERKYESKERSDTASKHKDCGANLINKSSIENSLLRNPLRLNEVRGVVQTNCAYINNIKIFYMSLGHRAS